MLHKWPNHGCDLPVIGISSSEGKKAEKFWEYCPLFTITIFVLLGLSFACCLNVSPSSRSGQKPETQEWKKEMASVIHHHISSVGPFTNALVLCFWGPVTDGLIEGKTRAYKWILAGGRQSSCHRPDSAPNPVTEHGCNMNPAVPLWLAVIFIQLAHGMLLRDSAKEWTHFYMRHKLRSDVRLLMTNHINELIHHSSITLEGLAGTL